MSNDDTAAVITHEPATCANCDAVLVGAYCHVCGQSEHVHRSTGHVVEEFLHGVWHFDSKAWRTLPRLAFHPGRLTWDYVHGHRARYIAPIALFLLSIFMMFFVFGFIGAPDMGAAMATGPDGVTLSSAREAAANLKADMASTSRELAAARKTGDSSSVAAASTELATQRIALGIAERNVQRIAMTGNRPAGRTKSFTDSIAEQARAGQFKIDTGVPAIDENVRKALEQPEFAIFRVQTKAYKLSFLLVPLSLPFLWLLFFWRRDTTLYDHTVFALYSLSFMSLLFVLGIALMKASVWVPALGTIAGLLVLVPPFHIFAQLKGGYRLSTWGALWRTVLLSQIAVVILAIYVTFIVVIGLAD